MVPWLQSSSNYQIPESDAIHLECTQVLLPAATLQTGLEDAATSKDLSASTLKATSAAAEKVRRQHQRVVRPDIKSRLRLATVCVPFLFLSAAGQGTKDVLCCQWHHHTQCVQLHPPAGRELSTQLTSSHWLDASRSCPPPRTSPARTLLQRRTRLQPPPPSRPPPLLLPQMHLQRCKSNISVGNSVFLFTGG
jgi:hypothetical protein